MSVYTCVCDCVHVCACVSSVRACVRVCAGALYMHLLQKGIDNQYCYLHGTPIFITESLNCADSVAVAGKMFITNIWSQKFMLCYY